ncbi:hypothetical protein AMTRI_Chr11g93850 [Amborella trichopoda]
MTNETDGISLPNNDANTPYFLHHFDSPGTVLNKLAFIDGTLSKPESSSSFSLWKRCNDMVLTWSLSKDLQERIVCASTSFEVWSDLRDHFS